MSTYEFTCPNCKAIDEKKKTNKKGSVAKVDVKRTAKLQMKEKPMRSEEASHSSLSAATKAKAGGKASVVKKPAIPTKIVIKKQPVSGKQP